MESSLNHSNSDYKGVNIESEKKELIIFCQAPADVTYILNIYEQSLSENKVLVNIYVINVLAIYQFLQSLKLKANIVFIPYHPINLKRLVKVYSEKRRINYLWKKHFNNFRNGNVYFFSRFEDWLTPAFIYRFTQRKNFDVFYVSHYDNSYSLFEEKKFSFRPLIFIRLLKYLTGARFQDKISEKRPEFLWKKYRIKEKKPEIRIDDLLKYNYKLESPGEGKNNPNVLLFISPCNKELFDPASYSETCVNIVMKLQAYGFNVYIKGHPRMGAPDNLKDVTGFEIPSYIPGEFIDAKNFKYCFGIDTVAICFFAKNKILPTYSLIKMFPSLSVSNKNNAINYLMQQSENKIKFLNNMNEFISLFNS